MSALRFASTHEWVKEEGEGKARIGITDYAQDQLGDVVFVELPAPGDTIAKKEGMGSVESVKAVSDLYAPVSGEVLEVNEELEPHPEWVNEDPLGKGWMLLIKLSDPGELNDIMDQTAYDAFVKEEQEH